ncbi:unnamed protein product, partial [marine sediment metagenome]
MIAKPMTATELEIISDAIELDLYLKLKHRFGPGLYLREITIPK